MVKHMATALDRRDERHQQSKIYIFSLENKLPRQLHSVGTFSWELPVACCISGVFLAWSQSQGELWWPMVTYRCADSPLANVESLLSPGLALCLPAGSMRTSWTRDCWLEITQHDDRLHSFPLFSIHLQFPPRPFLNSRPACSLPASAVGTLAKCSQGTPQRRKVQSNMACQLCPGPPSGAKRYLHFKI